MPAAPRPYLDPGMVARYRRPFASDKPRRYAQRAACINQDDRDSRAGRHVYAHRMARRLPGLIAPRVVMHVYDVPNRAVKLYGGRIHVVHPRNQRGELLPELPAPVVTPFADDRIRQHIFEVYFVRILLYGGLPCGGRQKAVVRHILRRQRRVLRRRILHYEVEIA